jgi:hypothetical protein
VEPKPASAERAAGRARVKPRRASPGCSQNGRWCCAWTKSRFRRLTVPNRRCRCGPGCPTRRAHGYTRHGTTSLFAALEVVSGKVHGRCFKRHNHVEFIAFLESLAKRYPAASCIRSATIGTHKRPAVE